MPPDLIVIAARRAAEEDKTGDRQYRAPRTELQEQEGPLEATGHPPRVRPMEGRLGHAVYKSVDDIASTFPVSMQLMTAKSAIIRS